MPAEEDSESDSEGLKSVPTPAPTARVARFGSETATAATAVMMSGECLLFSWGQLPIAR